jgi:hypothetical protein
MKTVEEVVVANPGTANYQGISTVRVIELIREYFWRTYEANKEVVIFRKSVFGLIKVEIKLKQLYPYLVGIFGVPSKQHVTPEEA